jgi:hypothetical protein
MQFNTLYDVGATIWVAVHKPGVARVSCTVCSSTGVVTLEGEELQCPKCRGAKVPTGNSTAVALEMVIDRIICNHETATRIRYFGVREDGKHVEVEEAAAFATKQLAEESLES